MWFTILEDENCRENENGKMEEEKIENVGRARERGNIGFYEILLGVLLQSKRKMRRVEEGERKEVKHLVQKIYTILNWCVRCGVKCNAKQFDN